MTRLALAFACLLSCVGAAILLFLSFRASPGVAYSGVLLFASGKAVRLALAGEDR